MFILRIVQEDRKTKNAPFEQVIENFELGDAYTRLAKGRTSEFDDMIDREFPDFKKEEIESIICGSNGKKYFIEADTELTQRSYFIMTESGQTFERL
jgi:hypothetical protein